MSKHVYVYCCVWAAASMLILAGLETAPTAQVTTTTVVAPWANGGLRVTANRRFLEHENGKRFHYLADTAWGLFAKLDRAEVDLYMENTAAKGFTVVMAVALWDNSRRPNAYGDHPFARLADGKYDATRILTTPGSNPAIAAEYDYWDHVDYIISAAEAHGLYVGFLPTWGNYVCCTNTYARNTSSRIFDVTTARNYGRFLGQRYGRRPNMIWVNGGDRAAITRDAYGVLWDWRPVWRALAEGVGRGVTGQALTWDVASPGWDQLLMTFHPMRRIHGSSLWFHTDPWMDFNGIETEYDDIVSKTTIDWNKLPTKPTALLEARYEGTPAASDGKPFEGGYGQRFQQYHSFFSGALGFAYGHSRIWNLSDDGLDIPWYVALDDPGRSQMKNLLVLLNSLTPAQWLARQPDQSLIDGPIGTLPDEDYLAAMRGAGGDFALVYSTNGRDIRLNLEKLRAGVADAWWFNPRTATFSARVGGIATGPGVGVATFNPPGAPGYDNDWVLKLVVSSSVPAPLPAPAGTVNVDCTAVADTAIRASLTGAGGLGTIATAGSTTTPTHSLWRFSLTCVPAGKRIVTATLKWMVYQDAGRSMNQFDLYALKRSWQEGTASWTHWAGTSAWTKPGAADLTDRDPAVIGSIPAGAANVPAGTWVAARLNATGIEVLRQWHAGTQPHFGFLLQAASGTDTLRVLSSETGSSARRPRLELAYEP